MTKKILSTVAAAAVLGTGAMAFDTFDDAMLGKGLPYTAAVAAAPAAATAIATAPIAIAPRLGQGDGLIFPAFFVGGAWQTTVRVINTSSTNAVVAKVVLYAGNDSHEVRDFNIYLSAGDVWTGTIKVDTDGVAKLISTDDSSPLPGGGMADATNPMKSEAIDVPTGYIEVIGCAMAVDPNVAGHDYMGSAAAVGAPFTAADFKDARAHGDHAALRAAYNAAAKQIRAIASPTIFQNGMITSAANLPGVEAATAFTTPTNAGGDNKPDYFFAGVANVLTGDVRITDTVNGKDMVMPAIKLQNVTDDVAPVDVTGAGTTAAGTTQALAYIEGEAANIEDRVLTGVDGALGSTLGGPAVGLTGSEYDIAGLTADAATFLTNGVIMTYGDADNPVNNQLILTSPFKRLLINADATPNATSNVTPVVSNTNIGAAGSNLIAGIYNGVKSANNQITDWGYFTGLTLIFDESENQAQASQFSPASTPTLNFHYEVSASEQNPVPTDNLSYYLNQAGSAFAKGYANVGFVAGGAATPVPTIPTQMIATKAGGRTITNWIVPTIY